MTKVICPKCKKHSMHINTTFNSFPNYVCNGYVLSHKDKRYCDNVVPVHEYKGESK